MGHSKALEQSDMNTLRKVSKKELKKRRDKKLEELEDDIIDEEFLVCDVGVPKSENHNLRLLRRTKKLFASSCEGDHISTANIGNRVALRDEEITKGSACFDEVKVTKKGRGRSTLDFFQCKDGKPFQLHWNKFGQVVGENERKIRAACAYYAHCSMIWPLDKKWKQMTRSSWEDTWALLKNDFILDGHPNATTFIFGLIHDRFKDWKNKVKTIWETYHERPDVMDEKVAEDARIDVIQFQKLAVEWATSESQAKAEINRQNRNGRTMNHKCGRRSLAQRRFNFEKENKREPTDIDMMKIMYPRNVAVGKMEKKIQELQKDQAHSNLQVIEQQAYLQVVKHGRENYIRFLGAGHDKSIKRNERERLEASLRKSNEQQGNPKKLLEVITNQHMLIQRQTSWMQYHATCMQNLMQYVGFNPQNVPIIPRSGSNGKGADRNGESTENINENNASVHIAGFGEQSSLNAHAPLSFMGGSSLSNPFGLTQTYPSYPHFFQPHQILPSYPPFQPQSSGSTGNIGDRTGESSANVDNTGLGEQSTPNAYAPLFFMGVSSLPNPYGLPQTDPSYPHFFQPHQMLPSYHPFQPQRNFQQEVPVERPQSHSADNQSINGSVKTGTHASN